MINGQLQRQGGELVACPPKTAAGLRSIALDGSTVVALHRHRGRQQAELAALAADGGGYVFTNQRGQVHSAGHFGNGQPGQQEGPLSVPAIQVLDVSRHQREIWSFGAV